MEIKTIKEKQYLILEYDEGIVNGKQAISKKRYRTENYATDEGIRKAGLAIAKLTDKGILGTYAEKYEKIFEL